MIDQEKLIEIRNCLAPENFSFNSNGKPTKTSIAWGLDMITRCFGIAPVSNRNANTVLFKNPLP
jgi:hypothetical protein